MDNLVNCVDLDISRTLFDFIWNLETNMTLIDLGFYLYLGCPSKALRNFVFIPETSQRWKSERPGIAVDKIFLDGRFSRRLLFTFLRESKTD